MFESIKLAIMPYLMYIKIAAVAAVFMSGCVITRLYYTHELDQLTLKAKDVEIARQNIAAELMAKGSDIQIKFIKSAAVVETKAVDRVVQVVKYVPTEFITNGFVEFFNAGVQNRDLKTMTTDEISKSSKITQQRLAVVSSENNKMCNKYILQLNATIDLLETIEKTHNK